MSDWKNKTPAFYNLNDASSFLHGAINRPKRSILTNENQVEGTVNVAGPIDDVADVLKRDANQQARDGASAVSRDVIAGAGGLTKYARTWIARRPLSAVLMAAGLFYTLGRLSGRRD